MTFKEIICGREVGATNEIKKILGSDEKVICGFQQAGFGFSYLEYIFVTNKRIIKLSPDSLGFRTHVSDYLFKDVANVKIDNGIFRSSMRIIMRFNSDSMVIYDIPKDGVNKINKAIQEGIERQRQNVVIQKDDNMKMRICPKCGWQNEREAKFCSDCGSSFGIKKEE